MATESGLRPGRLGDGVVRHKHNECGRNTHKERQYPGLCRHLAEPSASRISKISTPISLASTLVLRASVKLNLIAIPQMTFP